MNVSDQDLDRRIASLTPEQPQLLELRRKRKQEAEAAIQPRPLPRVAGPNAFPLSFPQQRLWFLDQLEPGSAAYNLFEALRLTGPLDVETLDRAFTEMVRRQEALRTRFEETEGRAKQVVEPARPFAASRVDLRDLPESEREAVALHLAANAAQVPFD